MVTCHIAIHQVLVLPPETFQAMSSLIPSARGRSRAPSAARGLAFRRVHALVHNLVIAAVLLGRRPVIPTVPCELIKAVQPEQGLSDRSRFGVSHPGVVVTGPAEQPTCHLAPGA